ncbi:MAG: sodium:proton antiporter [Zetaproteobacteria bacterium]|nr:MAG: sodium:proton antiporter [Zetaproteobacteria bacterium]
MSDKVRDEILQVLCDVIDPDCGEDIVSLNMVSSLQINDEGEVVLLIEVDPERGAALENLRQDAERRLIALKSVKKASVILTAKTRPAPPKKKPAHDPHGMDKNPPIDVPARHIIVVASGKGGVGKSTVAANIAVFLAGNSQLSTGSGAGQNGQVRVGLLDADIYGPSQPVMMGDEDYKPALNAQKKLIPLERHNIKIMSIGFMVEKEKAVVWRGPMVQTAFYQMLRDVAWGSEEEPLDYLIIDLPPGTGDVQLTLAQKVRASGAVIVSTPQDIALIDARRAVEMFGKTGVPVLGLVENMSTHICSNCGHEEHIFGHGGASSEAQTLGIPFLGAIPLAKNIRFCADEGMPIVLAEPESAQAKAFGDIAHNVIAALK